MLPTIETVRSATESLAQNKKLALKTEVAKSLPMVLAYQVYAGHPTELSISDETMLRAHGSDIPKLGASWEFHLESRTLAQRRFDPDATAVHFSNLLGDGSSEAPATFSLCVGTVDLMELLEDAGKVGFGYARSCVGDGDGEVAVGSHGTDPYLPSVRELDGVADKIEEHLGEALLVTEANG